MTLRIRTLSALAALIALGSSGSASGTLTVISTDTTLPAGLHTVAAGDELRVLLGATLILDAGAQLQNFGSITIGGNLYVDPGAEYINANRTTIPPGGFLLINGLAFNVLGGLLDNRFNVFIGGRLFNEGSTIENDAQMFIRGEVTNNQGVIVNRGEIEFEYGAIFDSFQDGYLLNLGKIELLDGSLFQNSARIDNKRRFDDVSLAGNPFGTGGLLRVHSGALLGHQDRPPIGEGSLHNFGASILGGGALVNDATLGIENWGSIQAAVTGIGPLINCPFALVGSATNTSEAESCAGSGDRDDDGLSDEVDDDSSRASDLFHDLSILESSVDATYGLVLDRGDQQLEIRKLLEDGPEPLQFGIDVGALPGGGTKPASIRLCFKPDTFVSSVALDAGESLRVTCGSVTSEVLVGPIDHTFFADDGREFLASIEAGHTLTFEPEPATFTAGADNPGPIVIETDGVEFEVGSGDVVEAPLVTAIDIKPGGEPNSVSCRPGQLVPVAILTTDDFDATTVDHGTVRFEGASEAHADHDGTPRRHEDDVDGDGDLDLVLHFLLGDTDLPCDAASATLLGETFDGQLIAGTDSIRLLERGRRCGLGFELALLAGLAWRARRSSRRRHGNMASASSRAANSELPPHSSPLRAW